MMCLDLRELFDKTTFYLVTKWTEANQHRYDRIILGSSFCAISFLYSDIYSFAIDYCSANNIKISLATPVCSESLLLQGKDHIKYLIDCGKGIIDELIVNDIGMLKYATNSLSVNVFLGRLFFKDPRDGRRPEFIDRSSEIASLTCTDFLNWPNVAGVELDPITETLDLSAIQYYNGTVMLNGPFCYMSTGMICKFGSTQKPLIQKFRPSSLCGFECRHIIEEHYDSRISQKNTLVCAGKAVFFERSKIRTIGRSIDRYLYFPLKEYIQYLEENMK